MIEKLVRDIPGQRIIAEGGDVRVAAPSELYRLLAAKLIEEAKEIADAIDRGHVPEMNALLVDRVLEEIADVAEVFELLCQALGLSPSNVERLRAAKRERKGGFDQRLVWRQP